MRVKNRDRRQGLEQQEGELLVLVRGPGKIDSTRREANAKGQLPLTNGGELAAHMSDRITEHTHKTTFLENFEVRFRVFQAS